MNSGIRKARREDATAFLGIKNQLPLRMDDGAESRGGFLLGTDRATYEKYIAESLCLVAEKNGQVVGFGIVLGDAGLRKSDLWQRRHQAHWTIQMEEYEDKKLAYFEQLAFLSGNRKLLIRLVYEAAMALLADGCEYLLATTVHKPILNLAAVPFLLSADGHKVGEIEENYPVVGQILSDIYLVNMDWFRHKVQSHPLYPLVAS